MTKRGRELNVDFEALFERIYPSLVRFVGRMTSDSVAAEDIAQEAFIRLLEEDPPPTKPRVWLFVVARNAVRDRERVSARRAELLQREYDPPSGTPDPASVFEQRMAVSKVHRALALLSARDREMLLLRADGLRYRDIAEVCGVAPTSVGTLLARALKRFRDVYTAQTDGADSTGSAEARGK